MCPENGTGSGAASSVTTHKILGTAIYSVQTSHWAAPRRPSPWAPLNDIAYVWKAAEVCCAADSEASIRAGKMYEVVR